MRPLASVVAAATAATAATAAVAAGLSRRHRQVGPVAPPLRNPMLYVPMSIRNDAGLRIARRLMDKSPVGAVPDGVEVREELVDGDDRGSAVRVLIDEATGRPRPSGALLWIHGGGLVMGAAEQGQEICGRFADELGIVVANVDYRLAPEHPFPAALDDCYRALAWLHDQADELGVDPERIAVGGDSAGGGLAACLAQLALDRGGPPIRFQLLQYPMLDDRTPLHVDRDGLVWTNASNRFAWGAYLGHPPSEDESRPYASAARRTDVAGLPPAWIGIGDIDLFHGEAVDYAERLRASGVPCDLYVVPGMYHGADKLAAAAPMMRDYIAQMVGALGRAVGAAEPVAADSTS